MASIVEFHLAPIQSIIRMIFICTRFQVEKEPGVIGSWMSLIEPTSDWGRWMLGVGMMTTSLILGAHMGVFQEHIFKKYGNYPKEALYYTVN